MAYSMYHPGTISLTNGATAIVGVGTDFTRYAAGDRLTLPGIGGVTINTITDALNAVATTAWAGATVSGAAYDHDPMITGADVAQRMRDLIETLGNGNLQSMAGLALVADKLLYASGTNTLGLADLPASGRSLLAQPAAADKLAYFDSASTAALADLPASARSLLAQPAAADKLAYFDSASTAALAGLSAFGRTLIDDADALAARATLGAQQAACVATINAGSVTFAASTEYGMLPAGGTFIVNKGGFYAGNAVNGYPVLHVPLTGKYLLALQAYFFTSSAGHRLQLKINGVTKNVFSSRTSADLAGIATTMNVLDLTAGDYISQGDAGGASLYLYHALGHTQLSLVYLGA